MESAITEVLMPLMGEGINEATLVKWLKKPGEKVNRAEPLLEVSTDKVDTEIPSPADGFLVATFAEAGATVAINTLIATIGPTPDAAQSVKQPPKPTSAPTTKATVAPPASPTTTVPTPTPLVAPPILPPVNAATLVSGPLRSSPIVRKIARERGVDLYDVAGTGLGGRITKDDLLAYLADPLGRGVKRLRAATTPAPIQNEGGVSAKCRVPTVVNDGIETLEGVPVRREKMTKMRRLIAEHMVDSVRISPHVTTVFEIDMQQVVNLREKHRKAVEAREGFKLTFTPFFIHAAVEAIKKHPIVNVSIDGDEILFKDSINVACAVALESGLIVPVIKNAEKLDLLGVARNLNDLVTRARSKKLQPDEVKGGTFSITNPGGFGSITSNPIINQPQVAILGIGAIVKRPVVVQDEIAVRPVMLASLTFDHRVVDGEGGAMFLATFKKILETYSDSAL